MTVKQFKKLIADLPDDTQIEINTIWDNDACDLTPSAISEAHYDKKRKKIFITPETISI